jgi:metal-responsive CopG/Arc/MetJ family transcriptional regulator
MLYIMHRTQLYLEDDLWATLKARAKREKTSISELVRKAARERYAVDHEERKAAMLSIVGLWADRTDPPDTETYIRNLRDDNRLERLEIE